MNAVDQVPVLILHVLKADIPEDTGIVKQDINTAEVLNSGINDSLSVLNTVVVGNRLTTGGADLLDNEICGLKRRLVDAKTPQRSHRETHTFDD